MNDRPSLLSQTQEFVEELSGVQASDIHADVAAVVKLRADECMLLRFRYGIRFDAQQFPKLLGVTSEHLVVRRDDCSTELPDKPEVTRDIFFPQEAVEIVTCLLGLGKNGPCVRLAKATRHLFQREPEIAARDAAIPGRRSLPWAQAIKNLHSAS